MRALMFGVWLVGALWAWAIIAVGSWADDDAEKARIRREHLGQGRRG